MYDSLTIKNGRLFLPYGIYEGAVYAKKGKIVWMGMNSNAPDADVVIDASGLLVLPGVIDAHCHMRDLERSSFEDFESGTKSAAAGGIATLYDMPTTIPPTSHPESFKLKLEEASRKAVVDFGLYGGAGASSIGKIKEQADLGAIGFKTFTMVYPGRERDMEGLYTTDDWSLYEILREIAETNLYLSIHAENHDMILKYQERVVSEGRRDLFAYVDARPSVVEAETALKAIYLAQRAGAKINIAHVSAGETVEVMRLYKSLGAKVSGETCPHYLTFTVEEVARYGAYGKVAPPIRTKKDLEELWRGINDGTISMIVSDHAPFNEEMKERGRDDVFLAQAGFSGMQVMLPLMLTHMNKGRMGLNKLVETMAVNPAKFAGIFPKKGVIGIGSDADFTIVDTKEEWVIRVDELYTKDKAGATIYDGLKVVGRVKYTIVRGSIVAEDGYVEAKPGYGRFVRPLYPRSP